MKPGINISRFEPDNEPTGIIQFTHGFGEHAASYAAFAAFFTQHGYACVSYDQRGHGGLPRNQLGIVQDYNHFLDDIKTVREQISEWYPSKPVILYGHSMGGNIALCYLLKRSQTEFIKAIIETPWLRLYRKQPMGLVRVVGKLFPRFAIESKLVTDAISRDPEKVDALRKDTLYHNRMGLRIFSQIVDMGEYILRHSKELTLPVLLLGGEDDRIVCTKAIRELDAQTGVHIRYYEEPQGRHVLRDEIEPTKSEIRKRMLDFCCETY